MNVFWSFFCLALLVHLVSSKQLPGAPSIETFESISPSQVLVTWLPPTDSPDNIIKYIVKYQINDEMQWIDAETNETRFIIVIPERVSLLSVAVAPIIQTDENNEITPFGQFSDIKYLVLTNSDDNAPSNVILHQINDTLVLLTWEPPANPRGMVLHYSVLNKYNNENSWVQDVTQWLNYSIAIDSNTELVFAKVSAIIEDNVTFESSYSFAIPLQVMREENNTVTTSGFTTNPISDTETKREDQRTPPTPRYCPSWLAEYEMPDDYICADFTDEIETTMETTGLPTSDIMEQFKFSGAYIGGIVGLFALIIVLSAILFYFRRPRGNYNVDTWKIGAEKEAANKKDKISEGFRV